MKYRTFVIKRLMFIIPTFLGITFISWFLLELSGDPVAAYTGENAELMSEEQIQKLEKKYGLDRPWYERCFRYIIRLIQGDWGTSPSRGSVLKLYATSLPATVELGIFSMAVAILIGVPLGVTSAIKKNKITDSVIRVTYLTGYSIPVYFLALIISRTIYEINYDVAVAIDRDLIGTIPYYGRFNSKVFHYPSKILFGLLPKTGILAIDSVLSFQPILFIDAMFHIMLPVFALTFSLLAIVVKMTRSSMMETMKQDYILLARAKGLSERVIIYRHALRNAMIPTLTVSGLTLANLLTGMVFVEMIFYWPGIGGVFVWQGLNFMDMPIIQGYILITTTMFIVINVVIDLLYGFIDPRIRLIEM